MSGRLAHRSGTSLRTGGFALSALLLLVLSVLPIVAPTAAASPVNYPPFNVVITGPALLATNGSGVYYATATGGPAETLSGQYIGNYTFTDQILGVSTQGSFTSPFSGAFIDQQANLSLGGLVDDGSYTLELNVTSTSGGKAPVNLTRIFTYQFSVVAPYVVEATVNNENSYTVSGVAVQIDLDGVLVGETSLPSLAAAASTQVKYNYTSTGLSPGYHTFTLVLVGSYGLVEFSNGQTSYSVTFYVSGPAPDYTQYYLYGLTITVFCIFITIFFFGPRPRRKKKSP